MTTTNPTKRDETKSTPAHPPAVVEWTAKVLFGVETLRRMVEEARGIRPQDTDRRGGPPS
jgi:hypothetical protein